MKILVIGGGGREHAMAWKLAQSPSVTQIICSPGNPGCARIGPCFPGSNPGDWADIAEQHDVDLTVVGPEAPLVAGVVDRFHATGRTILGPTAAAARLEGSKQFSKDFMGRAGIPTAAHVAVTNAEEAIGALERFTYPVVLKADGLAAGKGVVIVQDSTEAIATIPLLLALNGKLVIEEFLPGEELSFIVLSDGRRAIHLPAAQDHKQLCDSDRGPNTGGMGAISTPQLLTPEQSAKIMTSIIEPALDQMAAEGAPFTGFLFAGLMMTSAGPKVLEFNVRLGDPETQAILPRLNGDLAAILMSAAQGNLDVKAFDCPESSSASVVLAAAGYPGQVRTGDPISGIVSAGALPDVTVFHSGTAFRVGADEADPTLVTAGGRVLAVSSQAQTLSVALDRIYEAVTHIHFQGMQFRHDIGSKGLHP